MEGIKLYLVATVVAAVYSSIRTDFNLSAHIALALVVPPPYISKGLGVPTVWSAHCLEYPLSGSAHYLASMGIMSHSSATRWEQVHTSTT